MMDNKIIANKIRIAAEEIQADSDYVYDPKHQNRPHGGGQWYKTEKGWTTHKPRRDPHKKGPQMDPETMSYTPEQRQLAREAKSKDFSIRREVAGNLNTPKRILSELANDPHPVVRNYVADNKNTPPETLAKLGKDELWNTRMMVAANPNSPMETLKDLANDKDERIRNHANLNIKMHNAPSKELKRAAGAGNENAKFILDNRKQLRHDFCEEEIGDEETYSQMKGYKKAIGEKKGWGRSPEQVKQDFIQNMDPSKYDSYEAFQDAKKRIQEMPTKKFDQLLGVIYNKDEDEEIVEEVK